MKAIKGVLLDIEGTLHVGGRAVDGASEAVNLMREKGLSLRFITNTTTVCADDLRARLGAMGLALERDELMPVTLAAARYLRNVGAATCLFVVRDAVRADFAGFKVDEAHPQYIVIGDIGPAWDYSLMSRLFHLVMEGSRILALHKGRYWQKDSSLALDIGAFIAGLEYATGTKAEVIGKPSKAFFSLALESIGLSAAEVVVAGDDIDADIGGAAESGILGVLVRTGKYRKSYVERSAIEPWKTIDSISDLPAILLEQGGR